MITTFKKEREWKHFPLNNAWLSFYNKCDINWNQVKKQMQLNHILERKDKPNLQNNKNPLLKIYLNELCVIESKYKGLS